MIRGDGGYGGSAGKNPQLGNLFGKQGYYADGGTEEEGKLHLPGHVPEVFGFNLLVILNIHHAPLERLR